MVVMGGGQETVSSVAFSIDVHVEHNSFFVLQSAPNMTSRPETFYMPLGSAVSCPCNDILKHSCGLACVLNGTRGRPQAAHSMLKAPWIALVCCWRRWLGWALLEALGTWTRVYTFALKSLPPIEAWLRRGRTKIARSRTLHLRSAGPECQLRCHPRMIIRYSYRWQALYLGN